MNRQWWLRLSVIIFSISIGRQLLLWNGQPEKQLRQQLTALGGERGLAWFQLPDSDDFANIPRDPDNPLSPDKVYLGQLLFHETALGNKPLIDEPSTRGTYTCVTCHPAKGGFQSGLRQAIGDGGAGFGKTGELRGKSDLYRPRELDVQKRKTPTVLNSAYQKLMFWDGQFGATGGNESTQNEWKEGTPARVNELGYEGLESQAIAAFEVHRMDFSDSLILAYPAYKALFDKAFPEVALTERYTVQTAGLAIAAFERTLLANQAPFQQWLRGKKSALSRKEKRGALLFFGKAGCVSCHTGPALNSEAFYALGMAELKGKPTFQTNGLANERLGRGGFTRQTEDMYQFKVPQLYNLADAGYYGHGATFRTVREVVAYKNAGVPQSKEIHADQLAAQFKSLDLSVKETDLITLFLTRSLRDPDLLRYQPIKVPSGKPFPASDSLSVHQGQLIGK